MACLLVSGASLWSLDHFLALSLSKGNEALVMSTIDCAARPWSRRVKLWPEGLIRVIPRRRTRLYL